MLSRYFEFLINCFVFEKYAITVKHSALLLINYMRGK